jgi:YidC/Oxa1 family membrane protein insertase
MSLFYDWTGNWGIAIILLTIAIKLLFFPLSAASYRSMAKMRLVTPKLEKIKEQYADDREQLNRAMMDLYKTEKINPLGGCLPVLIQIPVFIALFWSILASVEMRYAPFFGWITDLSVADPYYVLPLIMGISMVVQMRLNPTPLDPMQAKIMQIMPIAFSIVFFFFPAGLVLYSIVNNLLSIGQQWYITRAAEGETKVAAAKR